LGENGKIDKGVNPK